MEKANLNNQQSHISKDIWGGSKWPFIRSLFFLVRVRSWEDCASTKVPLKDNIKTNQISVLTLPLLCVCFGVLLAGNCMMYLVGQSYPVFTFSLINATQLALMHSSPFSSIHRSSLTPFIVNSLVLLTVSSTILFQPDHEKSLDHEKSYKKKCIIGFLCTVCASSGYGLTLSLIQLAFKKILREIL